MPKNWCFQTLVLEKTLESPLDGKEIKPVNAKGNQSWIFIGRTDAEAPILLSPGVKSRLIGKEPDAGTIEGERKRGWQDAMVGWHHWLNGQEQTLGDSEGQEAWHAAVRGVVKSQTGLSNWRMTWLCTLHTCLYNLYFLLPILFSYLGSLPFSYMDLRNGQMKPQSVRRSRIVKKAQRGDVVECQPFLRGP